MSKLSIVHRIGSLSRAGALAAILGFTFFLLWACHTVDSQDKFDIQGDSTWTACDTVTVILLDDSGKTLDTLYNAPLKSLDQLKALPADKYTGGNAKFKIQGRKSGGSCFDETRSFDGTAGKVTVDTVLAPETKILSLTVQPHALTLSSDDASAPVTASIKPAYAEQSYQWTLSDNKIATLEFPNGPASGKIKVKPLLNGVVTIRARSTKDTSKFDELVLTVQTASGSHVSLSADSLNLFFGGPGDFLQAKVLPEGSSQAVEWSSDDKKIAEVDSLGNVKGIGEGTTHIVAKSKALGVSAYAVVTVKRDLPVLTVASRAGAAVNVPIIFAPAVTQQFGSTVMFKWDLDGDGNWDDSLEGDWTGKTVDLPEKTGKYSKEGNYSIGFLVRDSEGNEAVIHVNVEIGNQPPEILAISADTLISIKDSIRLFAKVKDYEGTVASGAWDYDGDGKFDDSLAVKDSVVDLVFGHTYKDVGSFNAILRVRDESGKTRMDTVKIKVVLDPPVADAGNDTTVMAGTLVQGHAKGTDKFGPIVTREIKIAGGAFIALSKQDTAVRPPVDSGKFPIVVRVTDNDGNSAMDTLIVTVSTPSKSNADLADLGASAGTLTPSFKAVTAFYSLGVAYADSQVTVKATTADTGAKLAINGKPVASGAASDPVSIAVGTAVNVFQLVVTAQDGTQKVYAISVTRAPSAEAQLSKLEATGITLKPDFSSSILAYADTVANALASITLKPTVSNVGAKVSVNDSTLPSGTVSNPLPLKVGDNLMQVLVTAQDGKTKATYTVKVVRRAKLILSRKLGDLAATQTDSIEAPLGSTVKINSADTTGYHFSKWGITEGTAAVSDSAADSTMLTLQAATVRANAAFAINIYTITTLAGAGGIFNPPSAIVKHGDSVTITISPLTGYRILTFKDNGEGAIALGSKLGVWRYTLKNVSGIHNLEATFMPYFTMSAASSANGSVVNPAAPVTVDAGGSYTFQFKAVSAAYTLTELSDGTGGVPIPVPDSSGSFNYTVSNISADHNLTATFAIKTFTLKINGHFLCVRQVVTCTDPGLCLIKLCLAGSGPDTDSLTVNYGSSFNITTADSLDTRPFVNWAKDGASFATTTSITTNPITSNVTYTANYKPAIIIKCCPGICCTIGTTPVLTEPLLTSPSTAPPPMPQSMLPLPEN